MKSTLLFKDLFSFQVVFDKESHVRSREKFLYTFSWFPSKLYPTSLRILAYDGIKAVNPPPPHARPPESSAKIFVKNVEKNALENLDKQSSSNSWL